MLTTKENNDIIKLLNIKKKKARKNYEKSYKSNFYNAQFN